MQESGRAQPPVNVTGEQLRRGSNLNRQQFLSEIGAQARWQNMLAPVYGIEVVAARAVCNYKVRIVSSLPKCSEFCLTCSFSSNCQHAIADESTRLATFGCALHILLMYSNCCRALARWQLASCWTGY